MVVVVPAVVWDRGMGGRGRLDRFVSSHVNIALPARAFVGPASKLNLSFKQRLFCLFVMPRAKKQKRLTPNQKTRRNRDLDPCKAPGQAIRVYDAAGNPRLRLIRVNREKQNALSQ